MARSCVSILTRLLNRMQHDTPSPSAPFHPVSILTRLLNRMQPDLMDHQAALLTVSILTRLLNRMQLPTVDRSITGQWFQSSPGFSTGCNVHQKPVPL